MRIGKAIMHSILMPIRALNRAKNFYVKNMESCAGRFGHADGMASGPSAAPVSLSNSYSINDEELRRLLRTVSTKNSGVNLYTNSAGKAAGYGGGMGMRSYSVGLGKIGRIDENKPCDFMEDEDTLRADLYSRNRSYAVRRTSSMYRR